MPKVKIEQFAHDAKYGIAGYGCRIWVDDKELQEVSDIKVDIPVDGILQVSVRMNVTESLIIQADNALLKVELVVPPGYILTESLGADGAKRYRAEQPVVYGKPPLKDVQELIRQIGADMKYGPAKMYNMPFTPFLGEAPIFATCQRGDCLNKPIGTMHLGKEDFYICASCKAELFS